MCINMWLSVLTHAYISLEKYVAVGGMVQSAPYLYVSIDACRGGVQVGADEYNFVSVIPV